MYVCMYVCTGMYLPVGMSMSAGCLYVVRRFGWGNFKNKTQATLNLHIQLQLTIMTHNEVDTMATTETPASTPAMTSPELTYVLSAKENQEQVWKHLTKHVHFESTKEEREWPSYNEVLQDVRKSDYNEILTCPFDLHPGRNTIHWKGIGFGNLRRLNHHQKPKQQRRCKTICPHGVVACCKLELFSFPNNVKGRPYTGMLAPEQTVEHCLIRLSSALRTMDHKNDQRMAKMMLGEKLVNAKLFPAVALKLFRSSGVESANILFVGCKVGQESDRFFQHCVSSQITSRMPATLKPILRIFKKYSEHPLALGISNLCGYNANGDMCEDLNFPFCLTLKPRDDIVLSSLKSESSVQQDQSTSTGTKSVPSSKTSFAFGIKRQAPKVNDSFLDELRSIPVGTVLYDVFASPNPLSVVDPSKLQRIGRLVTTSEMKDSPPDDGLFFRHQKKDEDFALRPHWKEDYLNTPVALSDGTTGTVATLAGWELFEHQIKNQGGYVDFERKEESKDD